MALNFPNNPAVNQVYTVNQKSWRWTGTAWNVVSSGFDLSTAPSFTTISVPGQNNVVADVAADTLTLAAGQGIVITTNSPTDTITFTSVATTGNITIVDETIDTINNGPITIVPNLQLGGTLRFPDNTVQSTATLQGPQGPEGPVGPTGSGAGDVSSVGGGYLDNAIVRYNGTSGTSIQTSLASINDGGTISAVAFSGIGTSLTALNASNLSSGTLPDARFPVTLPAVSGINLTALNASNLGSGTVPVARLGTTGTRDATTFLRGDNTWAVVVTDDGATSDSFATIVVAGQDNIVADSSTDTLTLVAGAGITLTTNASTDTITIASSAASQNTFSTVAVTGQSNVVAESGSDTLNIAAGAGISITTNSETDTVTITSTAAEGVTAFSALSDAISASLTVNKFYLPAITALAVSNNGASAYRFDQYGAADNPTIYAINGTTIAFNLNVTGHPFVIQNGAGVNYNTGLIHVETNGIVTTGSSAQGKTSGTLYWKIPTEISGGYRYQCSVHAPMVGSITIKNFSTV